MDGVEVEEDEEEEHGGGGRRMRREFEIWTVRRVKVVVGVQRTASSEGRPFMVRL